MLPTYQPRTLLESGSHNPLPQDLRPKALGQPLPHDSNLDSAPYLGEHVLLDQPYPEA